MKVISEIVISQNKSYCRVKRYIEGWYPYLGTLIFGLTGKETVIETDVIKPSLTIFIDNNYQ